MCRGLKQHSMFGGRGALAAEAAVTWAKWVLQPGVRQPWCYCPQESNAGIPFSRNEVSTP